MSDPDFNWLRPEVAVDTPIREQAYHLVYEQYLAQGYTRAKDSGLWLTLFDGLENTSTLVIQNDDEVVRTLTLIPDGPMGLPADDLFKDRLDDLRSQGRLGEVSAFAAHHDRDHRIDGAISLINAATLLGLRNGLTHFVITVNPKHVSFYRRGLGFEPIGDVRSYDKVHGAPAQLMVGVLKDAVKTIHGREGAAGSLYHHFWTPDEARRTGVRLVGDHRPMSVEQLEHFFLVRTPLWHQANEAWQTLILGGRDAPSLASADSAELIKPPPKHMVVAVPPQSNLLDRATFHQLVRAAIRAPSANNLQPWAFGRLGDDIEVFYVRGRALKSDVGDLFGLMGLGAAVESIVLEAGGRGLAAEVTIDEDRHVRMDDKERVARIRLTEHGEPDALVKHLKNRHTDRRPYAQVALTDSEMATISQAVAGPSSRFHFVRDRAAIDRAAHIAAQADQIRFETDWLYEEIRSALRRDAGERTGLDARLLGIPPGTDLALPLLGPWARLRALNVLGASLLAAAFSERQLSHTGALGLLSLDLDSDLGKLTGGRDLLRVWLAAESLGLSVHPVGALPLLLARVHALQGEALSAEHVALLGDLQTQLEEVFPPEPGGQRPALLIRVGRPSAPADDLRAERLFLEEVVEGEADDRD